MTPNPFRLILRLACLAAPLAAFAAPVTESTPVHLQPDSDAPIVTELRPGSEPAIAPDTSAPAGWTAVLLPGPHDIYVENRDITKSLDVKAGAALRFEPRTDAPVVAQATANEPVEITGLRGRWTQLRLSRPVTGYARIPTTPSPAAPAVSSSATSVASTPLRDAPQLDPATQTPPPAQGRAVPMVDRGDGGVSGLPRLFEGRFVSTRAPFRPRRPYDYALENESGARIAYLDVSKLLLTDQIQNYLDRTVTAFGPAKMVPGSKELVVSVESLQLR